MADKKFEDVVEASLPEYSSSVKHQHDSEDISVGETVEVGKLAHHDGEYHRSFTARQIHVCLPI